MKDKVIATTTRDVSHIKEVKETRNVEEVNKLLKSNWEILVAAPHAIPVAGIATEKNTNVLFILGRSDN